MSKRSQLLCLWCLPLGLLLFTAGWILAQYFPPPSETLTAQAMQAIDIHHATEIRVGINLMAMGGVLTVPFAAAIMVQMSRIEGQRAPLAYTQIGMAIAGAVIFIVPLYPLVAAVYRPHSDAQTIRMLHDMFWVPYVGSYWTFAGQAIAIGALALRTTAASPLPRWFGYQCFFTALGLATSSLVLFFKTGPFAATGLFGLWVPAVVAYFWYMATVFVFHRAIVSEAQPGQIESQRVATVGVGAQRATTQVG